jgi:hypothetical protein
MKSARRPARSRSAGYRLDALRELALAPIIYLGPPMVCAAPLLLLYWLYQPAVLTNPGLSSLREPVAMALLLPPGPPASREDVGTSGEPPFADGTEDFAEPEPAAKKPSSPPGTRVSRRNVGRRSLRIAGSVRRPTSTYNVGAAVANPGWYTGTSRGAASAYAYAYAAEQSGRHRW